MGKCLWDNIEFTCDDHFIDYYIILDGVFDKNIYYNKDKTIFLKSDNQSIKYYLWEINLNYFQLKYGIVEKKYNKILKNNEIDLDDILNYKYLVVNDEKSLIEGILAECLCIYSGNSNIVNKDCYINDSNSNSNSNSNVLVNKLLWEKYIDKIRTEKRRILDDYNICTYFSNEIKKYL